MYTYKFRKEQEEELRIYERMRVYRQGADEADFRLTDARKRLQEMKSNGLNNLNANELLNKLNKDVKEINNKREQLEIQLTEREMFLEKLSSWDKPISEDDLQYKRRQLDALEDDIEDYNHRLSDAIERNNKLEVFRQASAGKYTYSLTHMYIYL